MKNFVPRSLAWWQESCCRLNNDRVIARRALPDEAISVIVLEIASTASQSRNDGEGCFLCRVESESY